jgi:uncharacterized protein (TIRG00374 family)
MKRFERLAFAGGLLLLAWLVHRIGARSVLQSLGILGWGFALVVLFQAVPVLLNTLAWRAAVDRGRQVPIRALAPALVAGEAVNAVSPIGFVGGELLRIGLLSRRIPTQAAVGATGLAAMAQFAAQAVFVLSGLPILLGRVEDPALRVGLVALSGSAAALLGLVLLLGLWTRARNRVHGWLDGLGWLQRLLRRLPESLRRLTPEVGRAFRDRPGRFAVSVAVSFLAWQMGVVETLLVLALLRQPVDIATALTIEVLAVMIEGALFFVPARMGTQEGGRVLVFLALGLNPATGLALGLVRRLRELAWAAVGLALLGRFQRSPQRGDAGPNLSGITRMRPAPGSQT